MHNMERKQRLNPQLLNIKNFTLTLWLILKDVIFTHALDSHCFCKLLYCFISVESLVEKGKFVFVKCWLACISNKFYNMYMLVHACVCACVCVCARECVRVC